MFRWSATKRQVLMSHAFFPPRITTNPTGLTLQQEKKKSKMTVGFFLYIFFHPSSCLSAFIHTAGSMSDLLLFILTYWDCLCSIVFWVLPWRASSGNTLKHWKAISFYCYSSLSSMVLPNVDDTLEHVLLSIKNLNISFYLIFVC